MTIVNKLLEGSDFGDRVDPPRCDVVSMYLMEVAGDSAMGGPDIGLDTARRYGIPMYHSVASALCRGGEHLDVDGVVVIGEHGSWPEDEQGRLLYPRRELFDQIVGVFRQAGRVVPVYNDKELSWSWPWAMHMWSQVQELGIPFMAGSSLPWADYRPRVPLPAGQELDRIAVVCTGEPFGRWVSHAVEVGQSVAERRAGGERGVVRLRCTRGGGALAHVRSVSGEETVRAALSRVGLAAEDDAGWGSDCAVVEVVYEDGLRTTVIMMPIAAPRSVGFAYALRHSTQIRSTVYTGDPPPRVRHFAPLVRGIEELMITGSPPIAPERVLLTTGIQAYAFASAAAGGDWIEVDDLDIRYTAPSVPEEWHEVLR